MRRSLGGLAFALLLAACDGSPARLQDPPSGAAVKLRRTKVMVNHMVQDPARRYPRGPSTLCSWDRDRYLHFFSDDADRAAEVAFLDAAGKVLELAHLPAGREKGITSKFESRHALFLDPGTIESDGLAAGDTVAFFPAIKAAKVDPMPVVKMGDASVLVETSHLLSQRMRGLMHRPRLSKDDGMLFLYPRAEERSYWMKNTLIPLDIAYFDAAGNLLNVRRMKPAADPEKGGELKAPSAGPARFVLEVNYGWFDARGLIDAEGKPLKPVRLEIPDDLRRLADQAE
ncbi:MAG TPA: DUF192 domain-containing protein [Planctomycetota bacterium]|jgi:uncharacterized membrane protein (UPF0127 family)